MSNGNLLNANCNNNYYGEMLNCATCGSNGQMSCSDVTSVVIQAILDLAGTYGSTQTEIFDYLPVLCPDLVITEEELAVVIARAARQGSLRRVILTVDAEPTFMVNAYSNLFNPAVNSKYSRYPCQSNSYFRGK